MTITDKINELTVKEISLADLPDLVKVENSAYEEPWTGRQFSRRLKKTNVVGLVAIINGQLVGFVIAEVLKDFFHVVNIAVMPGYRRKGAGKALIKHLLAKMKSTNHSRTIAMIREINLTVQLFLRHCGFRAVEIVRNQYKDSTDDCYRMEFRLKWHAKEVQNDTKGRFAKINRSSQP